MDYLIDISGTCNLKCPSCPVGNFGNADFSEVKRPKGFMELELFKKVVAKARSDSAARNEQCGIYLYNWGEALIHPKIAEICQHLQRERLPFHISSNMNNDAPLKQIVRAGPASFRISLSGFTQARYGKGHVGGDANLVISNMYRLRSAMDHCDSKMPVEVFYHVYRDNCDEELLRMAQLSADLGFYFHPGWAYLMNFEKKLAYMQGKAPFSERDKETMARTVVTLDEEIALAQEAKSPSCYLQTNQTVINHDGSVALCCAVYDPIHFVSNDFLSISDGDLQKTRREHPTCAKCMSLGLHDVGSYKPEELWDKFANRRQQELGQRITTTMFFKPHIHVRQEEKVGVFKTTVRKIIGIKAVH